MMSLDDLGYDQHDGEPVGPVVWLVRIGIVVAGCLYFVSHFL